jgi:hypothetical protein
MNLNARPRKVWQAYSFKDPRTFLSMGYIQGEGRSQGTLFPVVLDDFVPADRVCGVIDALNPLRGRAGMLSPYSVRVPQWSKLPKWRLRRQL